MEHLSISLDPRTLDIATGKRKLKSIEIDGTLQYDDPRDPDSELTETLGRIWNEYPGGMLDISEAVLESRNPDDPAVMEKAVEVVKEDEETEKGMMMSFEEMSKMRTNILEQLNQSRNELWFVLELAKTLKESSAYTNTPPPPPSLIPQVTKPMQKPKAQQTAAALSQSSTSTVDPLVLAPGTFSTTPAAPPPKSLLAEVIDLETAVAAKQAVLEQCGQMIDSAVNELTSMTSASDAFWADVRRLKEGKKGRGQWAVVPRPDFERVAGSQKARDVIIPYAIDEGRSSRLRGSSLASAGMRARSLAAFDLDPKKKELAFGARSHLRLHVTILGEDGILQESSVPGPLSADADVGERMDEAQMESFDEELFGEIRAEIMRRGGGTVDTQMVQFEIGGDTLKISLVDTRTHTSFIDGQEKTNMGNMVIDCCRLSLLQMLRARKRRQVCNLNPVKQTRAPSLLAPLAQMIAHVKVSDRVSLALQTLNRTLQSAGIKSSIIKRPSGDRPEVLARTMDDGSLEHTGCITTLEIPKCPGIMLQTLPASPPLINTSKASFSVPDPTEVLPILADAIASQILAALLTVIKDSAGDLRGRIYLDEMEDMISLGDRGVLRLSIPPPWDAVHAKVYGNEELIFDSRRSPSIMDWARTILNQDMDVS